MIENPPTRNQILFFLHYLPSWAGEARLMLRGLFPKSERISQKWKMKIKNRNIVFLASIRENPLEIKYS